MRESKSEELSAKVAAGEPQKSPLRPRFRAVIVDGSSDWCPLASAVLKMEDCVELVARVEDGQQAIEAVSVLLPELLIMDLGIGSIDALTRPRFCAISFHRWL